MSVFYSILAFVYFLLYVLKKKNFGALSNILKLEIIKLF